MNGKTIDISGQYFNRFQAIKPVGRNKNGEVLWECICICGVNKTHSIGTLRYGRIKSCGCLKREVDKKKIKEITSKRSKEYIQTLLFKKFNRLEVIDIYPKENKKEQKFICVCDCGNFTIVNGSNLKYNRVKSCGCILMEFMNAQRGINHPQWRHDLSMEQRIINNNRNIYGPVTAWRKKIFKQDNYTCQITGIRKCPLRAHHLNGWRDFPKERFDIDNGITLSFQIHKLFHKMYGNKNNTKQQFYEFKKRYLRGEFNG